ncbi:uncharacterized protein MONBRDRAFT_4761 [Monosiga brevicollis MX1]|uniref:EGF-like domain-containing protein n=1 Tax=Monosiga brevicollis TaxID=81824 RepID=A9UNV3_MONBE|nr:uncharacterized protein MONBRDRAFT_4761 [Monosiga brevicollis MX1]EDQ92308.1 predicted protein [Monosiga brevicollis MX1]|eukprot:XP_001742070.1 hypothetical protein [Monosiga brevicollis MX1]
MAMGSQYRIRHVRRNPRGSGTPCPHLVEERACSAMCHSPCPSDVQDPAQVCDPTLNPCAFAQCGQEGTCHNQALCRCRHGWLGARCQCNATMCLSLSAATCHSNGTVVCDSCPDGPLCESAVPTCTTDASCGLGTLCNGVACVCEYGRSQSGTSCDRQLPALDPASTCQNATTPAVCQPWRYDLPRGTLAGPGVVVACAASSCCFSPCLDDAALQIQARDLIPPGQGGPVLAFLSTGVPGLVSRPMSMHAVDPRSSALWQLPMTASTLFRLPIDTQRATLWAVEMPNGQRPLTVLAEATRTVLQVQTWNNNATAPLSNMRVSAVFDDRWHHLSVRLDKFKLTLCLDNRAVVTLDGDFRGSLDADNKIVFTASNVTQAVGVLDLTSWRLLPGRSSAEGAFAPLDLLVLTELRAVQERTPVALTGHAYSTGAGAINLRAGFRVDFAFEQEATQDTAVLMAKHDRTGGILWAIFISQAEHRLIFYYHIEATYAAGSNMLSRVYTLPSQMHTQPITQHAHDSAEGFWRVLPRYLRAEQQTHMGAHRNNDSNINVKRPKTIDTAAQTDPTVQVAPTLPQHHGKQVQAKQAEEFVFVLAKSSIRSTWTVMSMPGPAAGVWGPTHDIKKTTSLLRCSDIQQ